MIYRTCIQPLRRLLLASMIILCANVSRADDLTGFLTGQELLDDCNLAIQVLNGEEVNSPIVAAHIAECKNYVRGVVEDQLSDPEKSAKCRPEENISLNAMIRITAKFLKDRPAKLELPAPVVIRIALAKLSSCEES